MAQLQSPTILQEVNSKRIRLLPLPIHSTFNVCMKVCFIHYCILYSWISYSWNFYRLIFIATVTFWFINMKTMGYEIRLRTMLNHVLRPYVLITEFLNFYFEDTALKHKILLSVFSCKQWTSFETRKQLGKRGWPKHCDFKV